MCDDVFYVRQSEFKRLSVVKSLESSKVLEVSLDKVRELEKQFTSLFLG